MVQISESEYKRLLRNEAKLSFLHAILFVVLLVGIMYVAAAKHAEEKYGYVDWDITQAIVHDYFTDSEHPPMELEEFVHFIKVVVMGTAIGMVTVMFIMLYKNRDLIKTRYHENKERERKAREQQDMDKEQN